VPGAKTPVQGHGGSSAVHGANSPLQGHGGSSAVPGAKTPVQAALTRGPRSSHDSQQSAVHSPHFQQRSLSPPGAFRSGSKETGLLSSSASMPIIRSSHHGAPHAGKAPVPLASLPANDVDASAPRVSGASAQAESADPSPPAGVAAGAAARATASAAANAARKETTDTVATTATEASSAPPDSLETSAVSEAKLVEEKSLTRISRLAKPRPRQVVTHESQKKHVRRNSEVSGTQLCNSVDAFFASLLRKDIPNFKHGSAKRRISPPPASFSDHVTFGVDDADKAQLGADGSNVEDVSDYGHLSTVRVVDRTIARRASQQDL